MKKKKKWTQNPLTRYLFSRRDDIVSVGVNLSGASSVLPQRRLVSHTVHLNFFATHNRWVAAYHHYHYF